MKRNYISPEFKYVPANGSMNMLEQTSFFGSKMMDIEDSLNISNMNIIYYQDSVGEQLNYLIEKTTTPIVFSTIDDKKNNHTIASDISQSPDQLNSNTRWVISIDLSTILTNYLFATLKKARSFEGLKNNMTYYNSVDSAMIEYIKKNLLNRYTFESIEFYVEYVHLSQDGALRYKNTYVEILNQSSVTNKIQSILSDDKSKLTVILNQEQPSASYNFNYYFNLYFQKI